MNYRPLEPGEVIQSGDELQLHNGQWTPSMWQGEVVGQQTGFGKYRRPLPSTGLGLYLRKPLADLMPDERRQFVELLRAEMCTSCGKLDPHCQCDNDE